MADSVTSSPITQHEDLDPARVRVINEPAGMMLDWLRDVIYRYFLVLRAVNPGLAPPVRALLLLCPSLLHTDVAGCASSCPRLSRQRARSWVVAWSWATTCSTSATRSRGRPSPPCSSSSPAAVDAGVQVHPPLRTLPHAAAPARVQARGVAGGDRCGAKAMVVGAASPPASATERELRTCGGGEGTGQGSRRTSWCPVPARRP